jgi:hypothetical protein
MWGLEVDHHESEAAIAVTKERKLERFLKKKNANKEVVRKVERNERQAQHDKQQERHSRRLAPERQMLQQLRGVQSAFKLQKN